MGPSFCVCRQYLQRYAWNNETVSYTHLDVYKRQVLEQVIARHCGGDRNSPEYRMMFSSAADASLSGMQINGGIRGPWLRALQELANGKYISGLGKLLGGAAKAVKK